MPPSPFFPFEFFRVAFFTSFRFVTFTVTFSSGNSTNLRFSNFHVLNSPPVSGQSVNQKVSRGKIGVARLWIVVKRSDVFLSNGHWRTEPTGIRRVFEQHDIILKMDMSHIHES